MSEVVYMYSRNSDEGPWHEDLDSVKDDIFFEDEEEYKRTKEGKTVTIYRGVKHAVTHSDPIMGVGETVRESLQCWADEKGGDYAEDYLDDMTPDLEKELDEIVLAFLEARCKQPSFFDVVNIQPIEVVLD